LCLFVSVSVCGCTETKFESPLIFNLFIKEVEVKTLIQSTTWCSRTTFAGRINNFFEESISSTLMSSFYEWKCFPQFFSTLQFEFVIFSWENNGTKTAC